MLIRHCLKDHTRETIGFGKRRQHSIYRLAIFLVWRNYIKLRREKRCRSTPAMLLGLTKRALTEQQILAKRLFVSQIELPPLHGDYYWRRVKTRPLAVNRGHELRYDEHKDGYAVRSAGNDGQFDTRDDLVHRGVRDLRSTTVRDHRSTTVRDLRSQTVRDYRSNSVRIIDLRRGR